MYLQYSQHEFSECKIKKQKMCLLHWCIIKCSISITRGQNLLLNLRTSVRTACSCSSVWWPFTHSKKWCIYSGCGRCLCFGSSQRPRTPGSWTFHCCSINSTRWPNQTRQLLSHTALPPHSCTNLHHSQGGSLWIRIRIRTLYRSWRKLHRDKNNINIKMKLKLK